MQRGIVNAVYKCKQVAIMEKEMLFLHHDFLVKCDFLISESFDGPACDELLAESSDIGQIFCLADGDAMIIHVMSLSSLPVSHAVKPARLRVRRWAAGAGPTVSPPGRVSLRLGLASQVPSQ